MEAVRGGFWHMDVPSNTFETSDRLADLSAAPKLPGWICGATWRR